MPEITWEMIIDNLVESDKHLDRFEVNYDREIICKTKEDADCIADFLECIFNDVVIISEYDEPTIS